jgi:hydrogenase expression/formation protein HypE
MSAENPFDSCPAPILHHEEVLLGHGSGGTLTSQLIESIFLPAFSNPILARLIKGGLRPAALVSPSPRTPVVSPVFSGGDIGLLNGTVNAAMGGARFHLPPASPRGAPSSKTPNRPHHAGRGLDAALW